MTPADRAMDLLCLLSTEPAPIGLLADDLRLTARAVRHLVFVLRRRDFVVELLPGPRIVIPAAAWAECRAAAQRYWDRIHPAASSL